jgi:hypothetical protein
LLSLPHLFGTTLATIPGGAPYLSADPERVAHWRREVGAVEGLKVGIAWQGSPQHPRDRLRSVPLSAFEPLSRVEGVRLLSLQKGPGSEQLLQAGGSLGVIDLGSRLSSSSLMDTAAAMRALDLVITVDSAPAHLAGGLGVPVWVALPLAPDWRWLLNREDSPWYPSMRLFRQTEPCRWGPVFQRMADALAQRLADNRRPWQVSPAPPG